MVPFEDIYKVSMLLVLFGPSGAGKTTIACRLMEVLDDAYVISSDNFRSRVYDRMLREVVGTLGRHEVLILDATFYRKKWREKLKELTSGKDIIMNVFLYCPLETCLRRNRVREDAIPEVAVRTIWREFEIPEDPDIYIDTEKLSVEEAVDKILKTI